LNYRAVHRPLAEVTGFIHSIILKIIQRLFKKTRAYSEALSGASHNITCLTLAIIIDFRTNIISTLVFVFVD